MHLPVFRRLKRQFEELRFILSHPQTPWYAKALAGLVLAYVLSPVDLIPDFIPVLGFVDDALIVPLGIWCVMRLAPKEVRDAYRKSR